jgi:hypothetical protein
VSIGVEGVTAGDDGAGVGVDAGAELGAGADGVAGGGVAGWQAVTKSKMPKTIEQRIPRTILVPGLC